MIRRKIIAFQQLLYGIRICNCGTLFYFPLVDNSRLFIYVITIFDALNNLHPASDKL